MQDREKLTPPSVIKALSSFENPQTSHYVAAVSALDSEQSLEATKQSKFEVLYGRDALKAAQELTEAWPEKFLSAAKTNILALAKVQGTKNEKNPYWIAKTNGTIKRYDFIADEESEPTKVQITSIDEKKSREVKIQQVESVEDFLEGLKATVTAAQGSLYFCLSEEEFGRIPHEVRSETCEIGQRYSETRHWGWPYYGSDDSTLWFISNIKQVYNHQPAFLQTEFETKDQKNINIKKSFDKAVEWTLKRLDKGGNLLVSFSPNEQGAQFQGWKDSEDAYRHLDGSAPVHPIAPLENQFLVYQSLLNAAELYCEQGEIKQAEKLASQATKVKDAIFDHYWLEDEGFFATAVEVVDYDNQTSLKQQDLKTIPFKIKSSSIGWKMSSDFFKGHEDAYKKTIITLFTDLLGKWGLFTAAPEHSGNVFDAKSYHRGSSWPMDTVRVANELYKTGYHQLARQLYLRIIAVYQQTGKFPEYIVDADYLEDVGVDYPIVPNPADLEEDEDDNHTIPEPYQLWTASAVLVAKQRLGEIGRERNYQVSGFEKELLSNIDYFAFIDENGWVDFETREK
jgi:tetratricopeptide (TPR) repeat protein